ncbi:MAG: hypothetical protein MJ214_05615 [Bacilli bacterium]|nr:hypothetical protein [Bacilli bacterium]
MNKFKLLVAPLLVIPFIAACNNGGGDKPTEVKFSLSSDWPITVDGKVATVTIDWTPNDIIKFNSFTFTADPVKDNTVTFDQTGDPRPMTVTITFNEDITEDINGTLSFAYEDTTAKTTGNSSVSVTIYGPRSVLPIKCLHYQHLAGETHLVSEEQFEYNDKGLLTKSFNEFKMFEANETHEYEYDDKNNMTKDAYVMKQTGEPDYGFDTTYTYEYDTKDRITKMTTHKDGSSDGIGEYTYESDSTDWSTYKYSESGGTIFKNITRTFEDGLYVKSVDSIRNEYCYYTWDEYKCNTRVVTYGAEGKILANLESDETYEYHKNSPDKVKKYVLSNYESGEIERSYTTLTEYDERDRVTKITDFNGQQLSKYLEYEYAN